MSRPFTAGFRKDFVVSDKANLSFSLDGGRLFLGAAPPPEPEKNPDEEIPADEKVLVDLWHWKDDYIQPMQKVRAEQERNRSYRAVYHVKDKKFVQLADETMEERHSVERRPRYAIGRTIALTGSCRDYDPGLTDFYLVNTTDGTRKLLSDKTAFNVVAFAEREVCDLISTARTGTRTRFADGRDGQSDAEAWALTSLTKTTTRRHSRLLRYLPVGPKTIATS